ncbi:hypothetical protein GCM10027516_42990 [Niabella aquatica]
MNHQPYSAEILYLDNNGNALLLKAGSKSFKPSAFTSVMLSIPFRNGCQAELAEAYSQYTLRQAQGDNQHDILHLT